MNKFPSLKGYINDLLRSINGAIIHLDDMLLNLDQDSFMFDDVCLANDQLTQAFEYLLELRSSYYSKQIESYNSGYINYDINLLNNFITGIRLTVEYILKYENHATSRFVINNLVNALSILGSFKTERQEQNIIININAEDRKGDRNSFTKNKKILVIEDQKNIVDIIDRFLVNFGYVVVTCLTGKEARRVFNLYDAEFDLLIIDIHLPDIDGYELCKIFIDKKPDVKIMLMSGDILDGQQTHVSKDFSFLSKPFTLNDLKKYIDKII